MPNRLSVLRNIRSLRVAARGTPLEELKEYLNKLQIVVEEAEQAQIENEATQMERKNKIKEYIELMESDGINPNEVASFYGDSNAVIKSPRKTSTAEPKYEFTDSEGNRGTWAGRGRMPNYLKELIESGEDLENFLIKKDD